MKPLLRLMSERSSLKASWISRQKNSSLATYSGVMFAIDWVASVTRSRALALNANAADPAAPAVFRNVLRLHIVDFISDLLAFKFYGI